MKTKPYVPAGDDPEELLADKKRLGVAVELLDSVVLAETEGQKSGKAGSLTTAQLSAFQETCRVVRLMLLERNSRYATLDRNSAEPKRPDAYGCLVVVGLLIAILAVSAVLAILLEATP